MTLCFGVTVLMESLEALRNAIWPDIDAFFPRKKFNGMQLTSEHSVI
jgi:hypothetical protein